MPSRQHAIGIPEEPGTLATAEAARAVVQIGLAPVPDTLDPVELAAWTAVARAVFNLHEMITRY